MNTTDSRHAASNTPLRLWPGVALAVALVVGRFLVPLVAPGALIFGAPLALLAVIGGIAGAVAIVIWWLFFSRAPWAERLIVVGVMALAVAATSRVVHPSISNGMMGMMLPVYSAPLLGLALVAAAVVARKATSGFRRTTIAVAILIVCGAMTLVRTGGITGDGQSDLHWRWTPTPEDLLLAQAATEPERPAATVPAPPPPAPVAVAPSTGAEPASPTAGASVARVPETAATPERTAARAESPAPSDPSNVTAEGTGTSAPAIRRAEWPGFRGPNRDSVIAGAHIETDWSGSPPAELWRRPIGPGWSSFAVDGDLFYTQEQRGEDEIVACYRVSTGEPVWQHRDPVRFWESNGGAGPRATPTLHEGRVYTMGATGIVNALDAATGAVVWTRNAVTDTGKAIPDWGIASSPIVVDDVVIVAVAGQLAAYAATTGVSRWMGQPGGGGYSSPHLATIGGVPQVMLIRGARTISVAPADGTVLWEHSSGAPSVSIVQPALTAEGAVLIASGDGMGGGGVHRVAVAHGSGGWTVDERWMSRGLKPYFNDFVVHNGLAFGFDGNILACIDLADGTRKWKGGRYGNGQMVLLPDQDLLLVLSEDGELALVKATPDRFTEVTRMRALEGKTWNHPVLVGDTLLVRNGEEMAAFKMGTRAGSR